jgi:tRNA pseudouridine55 synthase
MIIPTLESLREVGWVLPVNKPLNWTSFDVVAKVRNALKKHYGVRVKIGHAGTLDPLATGVLVLCVGKATKSIDSWMNGEKGYTASITFGGTTASYDAETEVVTTGKMVPELSPDLWASIQEKFTGEIQQVPPIYSAIRVEGKRAYAEARKGNTTLELASRPVVIHSLELLENNKNTWMIKVQCGKGTYIRSLAHDMGAFLGCGAYLSGLERTQVGRLTTADCWLIEEILSALKTPNTSDLTTG